MCVCRFSCPPQLNLRLPQLAMVRARMDVWKHRLDAPLTLELHWPVPAGLGPSESVLVRVCARVWGLHPYPSPAMVAHLLLLLKKRACAARRCAPAPCWRRFVRVD